MRASQISLVWTIFVIVIQPCYDMTGSYPNRRIGGVREQVQLVTGEEVSLRNDSTTNLESFWPIRIKLYYSLGEHLDENEQDSLKQVIVRAVERVQRILSVKRVAGPLLLSRKACRGIRRDGINKGKCGQIHKGYTGEYCLDEFKIPDNHLEGFAVYNENNTKPSTTYFGHGEGLKDTDFVLYITSRTSDLCNPYKTSALAYASFCQLDEINRPIAGQVNFCPRNVKSQKFDEELLYITSLHELLHALGFSNKLFDKFMKCYDDDCQPWPKKVLAFREGKAHLVTDAVVREMRTHFNCSQDSEFGGPLETVRGKVTSHWDPYLMYSSVMGSKEQKPYATLIDRISLAVFEDSGWYKVNYAMADPFLWGKGQGCSFGHQELCKDQDGFCTENLTGCHHLRLSKARCNVDTTASKCGIFAADQVPCFLRPVNSSPHWDEIFLPSSRCFMSNISNPYVHSEQANPSEESSPRCYETKCDKTSYSVRVNGGDWTPCHSGSQAKIPSHQGFIQCPSYEEICLEFSTKEESNKQSESVKINALGETTGNLVLTEMSTIADPLFTVAKNRGTKAVSFFTRCSCTFHTQFRISFACWYLLLIQAFCYIFS